MEEIVQRGEHLRFTLEAGDTLGVRGEGIGQDLYRDIPPELRITGAIHLTHAPSAKKAQDFIGADARAENDRQCV